MFFTSLRYSVENVNLKFKISLILFYIVDFFSTYNTLIFSLIKIFIAYLYYIDTEAVYLFFTYIFVRRKQFIYLFVSHPLIKTLYLYFTMKHDVSLSTPIGVKVHVIAYIIGINFFTSDGLILTCMHNTTP